MSAALTRFRYIAIAEGISFLVLLFIAMPLKYGLDMPMAVRIVGWIHGVLFILYAVFGHLAAIDQKWDWNFRIWAMGASLLPFATFVLERQLRAAHQPEEPA